MNQREMKERTKQFALKVIKLVNALPKNIQGQSIGKQLIRSGTSVGANYRSACRGRSKPEFIAKLGIVEEEADESAFWMELIIEEGLLEKELVEPLLNEADQLVAIIVASRKSAKTNLTNAKSEIGNRKSQIANRKSQIANRKSEIANEDKDIWITDPN
jgi:four helix bundle protein